MKRKIIVLLMGVTLMGLAGCSSKNDSKAGTEATSIQEVGDEGDTKEKNSDLTDKNSNKENAGDSTEKGSSKETDLSVEELLAMEANPQSDFLYVETDEGMVLTTYMGDGDTVVIPDEIDGIEVVRLHETFRWDDNIKNVVISGNVQLIDKDTFSGCENLEKVVIKEGDLKEIGRCAFYDCEKLSYINFPQGLETIDVMAFYKCKELKNIDIPDSVTDIDDTAFSESGIEE